ncbi:MAG: hypothetical protein NTX65_11240 [Ignavibacteriales bacterium]|nr:hypothetical protein [Ignavibacteriales bacterium]
MKTKIGNKFHIGVIVLTMILMASITGCNSDPITPVEEQFTIDGVWQSYKFDEGYAYRHVLLHLVRTGNTITGQGEYEDGLPFTIVNGQYTNSDISFAFVIEYTNVGRVEGFFNGNIKGKELVGHLTLTYSLGQELYAMHLIKQSITYFPKRSN